MDSQAKEPPGQPVSGNGAVWKARSALYRTIIERYKDYINEQEQKTVPVLKSLVNPDDAAVQALRQQIVTRIGEAKRAAASGRVVESRELDYSYETDFPDAARQAFEYVQSLSRTDSELSISFWLSYSEMASLGIADPFDRALLLCSLLDALGCKNAMVSVLELDDASAHPVVTFSAEKLFLLDCSNRKAGFAELADETKAGLVAKFETEDGKKATGIAYEFNREEYAEKE